VQKPSGGAVNGPCYAKWKCKYILSVETPNWLKQGKETHNMTRVFKSEVTQITQALEYASEASRRKRWI